jgi:hypothetical protein
LALIFYDTFSDHPSPVRSDRLKKVIAFLYANAVPCNLARQFYIACNAQASRFVTEQFNDWYYVWQRYRCKENMAEYFNMGLGKFIYIKGSYLNQIEPVLPEVLVKDFGIDKTLVPQPIQNALERIRQQNIQIEAVN